MEDLNKANETLSKLKDDDVRIIYVPPMTVAAAHSSVVEEKPVVIIEKFIRESGLLKIKPDARGMGVFKYSKENLKALADFNNSKEYLVEYMQRVKEYEVWVSIPDDMEVKAPLIKKTFEGGLYAAYLINNGSFEERRFFAEWLNASEKYELIDERPWFDKMLNYYSFMSNYGNPNRWDDIQTDLLLPIKKIAG